MKKVARERRMPLYLKIQTDGLLHESNTHAQKNTWYFNNNNKIKVMSNPW